MYRAFEAREGERLSLTLPSLFLVRSLPFLGIYSKLGVKPQWEDEGPWMGGRREGCLFPLPSVSTSK